MAKYFLFLYLGFIVSFEAYGQTQEAQEKCQYKAPYFLYEEKCSKCHTLERVFADPKTPEEWRICIDKMREKSPLWITAEEVSRIIDEIIGEKQDTIVSTPIQKK